jgi:hypothetical protein
LSDNAATNLVEKEIQTVLPGQPREKTLLQLGVALHPLQDSWSHQGEPDIPWTCSKQLAYGHPEKRGGWRKHDADLSYLHQVPDTTDTARRTYDKLVAFLANHSRLREHPAVPWNTLEPQVAEFAKAASRSEKRAWFQSQRDVPLSSYTSHPDFLDRINLPESRKTSASRITSFLMNANAAQLPSTGHLAAKDVYGFVGQFLNLWIVQHRPQQALELTNPDELAAPYVEGLRPGAGIEMTRSILSMWLVRDHGLVNSLGHGVENRPSMWKEFEELPQIDAGSLQSAIMGSGDQPYDIFPLTVRKGMESEKNEAYGVVFQFRHAPRDSVALIVVNDQKRGWVVDGLVWWVL